MVSLGYTVKVSGAFPLQAAGGESASSHSWRSGGSSSVWALPQGDPRKEWGYQARVVYWSDQVLIWKKEKVIS